MAKATFIAGPSSRPHGAHTTAHTSTSVSTHIPARAGSLKRKPPAKVLEDGIELIVISDSSDDERAARKRMKSTHTALQPPLAGGGRMQQAQGPKGRSTTVEILLAPAKRPRDIIELSSDGEIMEISTPAPPKKVWMLHYIS